MKPQEEMLKIKATEALAYLAFAVTTLFRIQFGSRNIPQSLL